MTKIYEVLVDGAKVGEVSGDFANPASPVRFDGGSTPFQVADARCRPLEAAKMILKWHYQTLGESLCKMMISGETAGRVVVVESLFGGVDMMRSK